VEDALDVSRMILDGFVTLNGYYGLRTRLRALPSPERLRAGRRNVCCTKRYSESRHYGVQAHDTPACRQAGTRARHFLNNLVEKVNAKRIDLNPY